MARDTVRQLLVFCGSQLLFNQQMGPAVPAQEGSATTTATQPFVVLHVASHSARVTFLSPSLWQPFAPHGDMSFEPQSILSCGVHGGPAGLAGTAGIGPCLPLGLPHWVRFQLAAAGRCAVTSRLVTKTSLADRSVARAMSGAVACIIVSAASGPVSVPVVPCPARAPGARRDVISTGSG